MQAQTLCARVAATLGEPRRVIERRGFQPAFPQRPLGGTWLHALDCPFCGQQVLIPPSTAGTFEVECGSCETAFDATQREVYRVSLDAAVKPVPRHLAFEAF